MKLIKLIKTMNSEIVNYKNILINSKTYSENKIIFELIGFNEIVGEHLQEIHLNDNDDKIVFTEFLSKVNKKLIQLLNSNQKSKLSVLENNNFYID